eukprot:gene23970-9542_t
MAPTVNWVCVLGDFGRSPRMQYHTLSMATDLADSEVYVIAYGGSAPIQDLSASNVHISSIPELPRTLDRLPRLLKLILKVLHQLFWLSWMMFFCLPRPSNILLQTPPAIPTMALCWLAARLRGASLVIDWHNFGYTIMALGYGATHPLVKIALAYEKFWGRQGDAHFCVTEAMKEELALRWGVQATVLYDRPPSFFKRTSVESAHNLFTRLHSDLCAPGFKDFLAPLAASNYGGEGMTVATAGPGSSSIGSSTQAQWRSQRPAILISSTSWTPDEDFGILLRAAMLYNNMVEKIHTASPDPPAAEGILPPLLLLITGKGPQKEMYLERIHGLTMRHVAIRTLWLEAVDYPMLLGAADVGVSLHASSSGLDLPMKVVDMFGAGLPVCALSYNCITELVEEEKTGLLFSSPEELADQLARLLRGFQSAPSELLKTLQEGVRTKEQGLRWAQNWRNVAAPVLQQKNKA